MNEQLRLALVTSKLSSAAGGLATSVPAMAHGLARFPDMDVTVIGTLDPAAPDEWQVWGQRVQALPVRGSAALQFAPSMNAHLSALSPDVIDVQGLWSWSSAATLIHHRRNGTPYVVTPRGMLDPWARRNSAWKKKIVSAVFEKKHLEGAVCLRATAEMEAGHFRAMGLRNPVAVIPNGVEIYPLLTRTPKKLRRVLLLSRIHPKKGIAMLLRVWAQLEPLYPMWELVIAGPDENGHTHELKLIANQLGLLRVRFAGPLYGDSKQQMYRDSDLFVLPTHAENFGLVIAEALAQEVPVITTHNAPWEGLGEQGCGWWIPLEDNALLSTMTEAISMDPSALQAMGQRGRIWMQSEFGWDGVVDRLRSMYEWIVRGGTTPAFVDKG